MFWYYTDVIDHQYFVLFETNFASHSKVVFITRFVCTIHSTYQVTQSFQRYTVIPYKHSTSSPPVGCWRTATPWQPANPHPLGGTKVGCKVGCQWTAGGWPPLSLCFYPLTHLCAYWLSASLLLASNGQPEAATLLTSAPQVWLPV